MTSAPRAVRPVSTDRHVDKSMRARQLASSVRNGRKITFIILDEDPIECYLAGWDEETYFVVYEYGNEVIKELIFKSAVLKVVLSDTGTFREERFYDEMNRIVRPFRDMINAEYFEKSE